MYKGSDDQLYGISQDSNQCHQERKTIERIQILYLAFHNICTYFDVSQNLII